MIDMNKKYQTRDGRAVRLFTMDLNSNHPVGGAITDSEGHEYLCSWTPEGYVAWGDTEADGDLVLTPEKHEGWAVMLGDKSLPNSCTFFRTKEAAEHQATWLGYGRAVFLTWEA